MDSEVPMPDPKSPPTPVAKPGDPIDLETSVAGEEDPGASFDVPPEPQARKQPPAGNPPANGKG
jgi:hypothetical protein